MDNPSTLTNSGAGSAPQDELPAGTVIGTRYELRRHLGRGASAHVYEAFDRQLRQSVAIKVLHAERTSGAALKRFRREVVAAREANNPHLLRLFDLGEAEGFVYLTMELADGGTVADLLRDGPLPIERVIDISAQLLEALDALHRAGVVHRDIKPSNVLIMRDGSVKLGDFGLVHRLNSSESILTADDALVGTWGYLSPEQAMGREVTPQSDLYSFGAVLFEMLTGARLFAGEFTIAEVVSRVFRKPPEVRTIRPEVPLWLARVVAGLLAKEPQDRYASAADALRDIGRRRARPRLRRASLIAAIAAAAALALAAFSWSRHRAAEFDHLADRGPQSIAAFARDGRMLWSYSPTLTRYTARVRMPGGRVLIAVVPMKAHSDDFDLQLLDPQSGRIVRRVPLPSGAPLYMQFSHEYGPVIVAADDIDGRGVDKVFVTFTHDLYWPSYTDVFDPESDRAWTLFAGSGHHRIIGFADVNGDGRKEVILCGPNNLMGWFNGVAAIPVTDRHTEVNDLAFSPDQDRSQTNPLLWYTLTRRGFTENALPLEDDPQRRILTIPLSGGLPVRLGYDGFLAGSGTKPARVREAARERAYSALRESQRLAAGGAPEQAVRSAAVAAAEANAAEDQYLEQWCERVQGKELIDAGRNADAESVFTKLLSRTAVSDSCFDAAHEFQKKKQLQLAVKWYHLGLGPGASASVGRLKYEFMEGIALSLGELGRWSEALHEVEVFRAEYPTIIAAYDDLELFVRWRATGVLPAPIVFDPNKTDLQRYWALELKYQAHEDPAALLPLVERERTRVSGSDVLLRSIEAGLLERLGRHAEALPLARSALDDARRMQDDPVVRTNLDLVEARWREIARSHS